MDKIVSDILKKFKGDGEVSLIVKIGSEYVFTLCDKSGEPLIDAFYSYKNGKIEPWKDQHKKIPEFIEASNHPLYKRGD